MRNFLDGRGLIVAVALVIALTAVVVTMLRSQPLGI
jgi:hypothetical protein